MTQNFELGTDSVLRSLTFYGYAIGGAVPVTDVLVEFYADALGEPGEVIFSQNIGLVTHNIVETSYFYVAADYSVNLPDLNFLAGKYFFGLQVLPYQNSLFWAISSHPGLPVQASDGVVHHIRLEDVYVSPVPEASTFNLLALGLAVVGLLAHGWRSKV